MKRDKGYQEKTRQENETIGHKNGRAGVKAA